MEKSELRKPLMQSAAIVVAIFALFAIISSSSTAGGIGGGILALFSGIGNLILFFIGLAIALPFSIAVVIGIFLGAVALYSRESSAQMYSDLKKNFSENIVTLKDKWASCGSQSNSTNPDNGTSEIKAGLTQLEENNTVLDTHIQKLKNKNSNLSENMEELQKTNGLLIKQIDELGRITGNLEKSNMELQDTVSNLSSTIEKGMAKDIKNKISALERNQDETAETFAAISAQLASLETSSKQSPPAGIFSYMENEADQKIFATTAEKAASLEMTYSQIDAYFTEHLSSELDKILKDHPSLTKTYLRNLRRD